MQAQINNPKQIPWQWEKTDTSQRNIPLEELSVALPRGAFPTIDFPEFISAQEALEAFFRHEPLIAVSLNGQAKGYPLNMLTTHEISNDTLAGVPILPTYCPLCNASVTYDRRFQWEGKDYVLEFEVSGMLRNSDMVMADKQTETWWQQLNGKGLVGKMAGAELEVIPSVVISVEEFAELYPQGRVLSPQTPSQDRYGKNPYVGYDDKDNKPYGRYFDHDQLDERLPPMERVVDLQVNGKFKVYPWSILAEQGLINDNFQNTPVVLFHSGKAVSVLDQKRIDQSRAVGTATLYSSQLGDRTLHFEDHPEEGKYKDKETGSIWTITGKAVEGPLEGEQLGIIPHSNHFAFAWLQFHPDSEIYQESP